jgi:hypothetical protein
VLALSVGIGVSAGAIPAGNGTIHGCFAKSGGALRVVDKAQAQECKGTERPLDWNTKGATGPAGPAGVSAAFEARGGNVTLSGLDSASANPIATLPGLAPGAYVVQAKLNVTGPGTTIARVICETTLGGVTDEGIVSNGSQGGFSGQQSIKMQLAVNVTAKAPATLRCFREGLVGNPPFVSDSSLIALRVGAVTRTP